MYIYKTISIIIYPYRRFMPLYIYMYIYIYIYIYLNIESKIRCSQYRVHLQLNKLCYNLLEVAS